MQNQFIYIDTYGCAANQNNSEIIAGLVTQSGYQITNNPEIADIHIINSCVVKSKTENKIKRRIQDLSKTNKQLIVTGCMPDADSKSITKLNPGALQLSTHDIKSISTLIKTNQSLPIIQSNKIIQHEEKVLLPKIPLNKLISITQILEGCLSSCSFCKTKLAKGNVFSYAQPAILKSIDSDLSNGAKEVWLTSQGNECFGMDRGQQELPELIVKITNLKHRFRIRIGMMNPKDVLTITNQLIEAYKSDKVYKFLHLPIQSGSNKVLKDMRRPYTIEEAKDIIHKFRTNFPNITIATDIITGYPTETNEDHKLTIKFIQEVKPDVLNLSKFSKHKHTPAENLIDLPIETINQRNQDTMRIHRDTALENKKKFLNKSTKVLVNKKISQDLYEARDNNYNIVLINSTDNILGKTIEVKITQLGVHHMVGQLLV
jgi:MiaB-like tRNA modifying enzyme